MSYLQGRASATPFYMARGRKAAERFEVNLKTWVKGEGLWYGVDKMGHMVRLPIEIKMGESDEM